MEKTLKQAVEANNIPAIREALVDIIVKDSGKTVPIQTVTKVLETTPGLFDVDNGKKYADSAADMNESLIQSLINDLKSNFSLEKFSLLTEVYAIKAENPDFFDKKGNSDSDVPDEIDIVIEERIVTDIPVDKEEKNTQSVEDDPYEGYVKPVDKGGRKLGAIIMALGFAAAIVGLCVPVRFLIGLGIGVFMLGTALYYVNMRKEPAAES